VEGELLVRFADDITNDKAAVRYKNQVLASAGGGSVKKSFKIVPGLSVIKLPDGLTVKEALKKFNKTSGILYAQPNYLVHTASRIHDDTRFSELWAMRNTGQTGEHRVRILMPLRPGICDRQQIIVVAMIDKY
jgi:hypothetical protein